MVELKEEEELPFLVGRSWALQDRLSCELNGLNKISSRLCRSCRVCPHCVRVSNNKPFHDHDEEKETLAGIRDSIRDVGNMLSSLQVLGARQRRQREVVETSLEESRARLIELVRRHRGTSAPRLVREMEALFGQTLSLSVTKKLTNDATCGSWRREVGPRAIWRWLIRVVRVGIMSPLVEWKRSLWSLWKTRTFLVLSLSIPALKAVVGKKTTFGLNGGGEDCTITDHTFDIFHGRG